MKRGPPAMTEAQARTVAAYARARTVCPVQEIQGKDLEETRRRIDEMEARHRRTFELLDRQGVWMARLFVVPIGLATLAEVLAIVWGLWSGEIHYAGKYAKGYALRGQAPMEFCVHCGLHAGLATLFGAITAALAKAAGWPPRRNRAASR